MAVPFLRSKRGIREIVSIDLGSRTTKAVHLMRKAEKVALLRYALLDAPIFERAPSVNLLSEHLKTVIQLLDARSKQVILSLGLNDSIVRHTEMPLMPTSDMRQILKNNTKTYLQQDLPGHVFDCFIIPPKDLQSSVEKQKTITPVTKVKILAAGTKKQTLDDLQSATKQAGLIPEQITPGLIAPANAFEMAMPEVHAKEIVALVDVGFKHSGICILQNGQIMLSRTVSIGGDRLTQGLAEALGITYAEAEGIKVGMPSEVQAHLEPLITPLGRELRASIDFFEHQQDKTVSKIFISGGSARSDFIVEMLQRELLAECKAWNPAAAVELMLPAQQTVEFEQIAPQLTVAVGGGLAAF